MSVVAAVLEEYFQAQLEPRVLQLLPLVQALLPLGLTVLILYSDLWTLWVVVAEVLVLGPMVIQVVLVVVVVGQLPPRLAVRLRLDRAMLVVLALLKPGTPQAVAVALGQLEATTRLRWAVLVVLGFHLQFQAQV